MKNSKYMERAAKSGSVLDDKLTETEKIQRMSHAMDIFHWGRGLLPYLKNQLGHGISFESQIHLNKPLYRCHGLWSHQGWMDA